MCSSLVERSASVRETLHISSIASSKTIELMLGWLIRNPLLLERDDMLTKLL